MNRIDDYNTIRGICDDLRALCRAHSQNRRKINDLFNGMPPYSPEEARKHNLIVNINFLRATRLAHFARAQLYNAFFNSPRFFTLHIDSGAPWARVAERVLTDAVNRMLRSSLRYHECLRAQFAADVLHGIGPAIWRTPYQDWCPDPLGIDELLVPAETRVGLDNLTYFAVSGRLTLSQLAPILDVRQEGWNHSVLEKIARIMMRALLDRAGATHSPWSITTMPERAGELARALGSGSAAGPLAAASPALPILDFFCWQTDPEPGWYRRIIIDKSDTASGLFISELGDDADAFLYSSPEPYIAGHDSVSCLCRILNVHFADLSAVSPFLYHNVRGLGYLLYGACHFENRFLSRILESAWENTLVYFQVAAPEQLDRAFKLELINRGVIDSSVRFVTPDQRHRPDPNILGLAMAQLGNQIQESVMPFIGPNPEERFGKSKKTETQVLAELQMTTTLLGSALTQIYFYQGLQYREIWRRIANALTEMRRRPVDAWPDWLNAYLPLRGLLKRLPADEQLWQTLAEPDTWTVEVERALGDGNRLLQMHTAAQLQGLLPHLAPDAARDALRDIVLAVTNDPDKTMRYVPVQAPQPEPDMETRADAIAAALMSGIPVQINDAEHMALVPLLLQRLVTSIQAALASGAAPSTDRVNGWSALLTHIRARIQLASEAGFDTSAFEQVSDNLQGLITRLAAAAAEAQRAGGTDPKLAEQMLRLQAKLAETRARIDAMEQIAAAKLRHLLQTHALRTAQRRVQAELQLDQQQRQAAIELETERQKAALKMAQQGATGEPPQPTPNQ